MNKEKQQYKYFAFISYNSHDTSWGKRLQRKLEGYRMPATLCSEHGWERNPIKPVLFLPPFISKQAITEYPVSLYCKLYHKQQKSQG